MLDFYFVDKVAKRGRYKAVFAEVPEEDEIDFAYGSSGLQIEMLRGDYLHDRGYSGSGVLIAVFDGGFHNTQNIPAFDHMRNEGNLQGTYSFVLQDSNVYTRGSHGTHVLSVMAAFSEGSFVGTAPDADYWLFMTEDQIVEVNAEEYNWLAAAEVSDSLGVDIINSSLGYSTFDPGQNDYSPADLDGQIGVVTQAALFAARKGILVVNSAGNAGADPTWKKVTKPADADSILAVGAVDVQQQWATFSSKGPTVDGRIKPDVVAMGDQARYIATNGFPTQGNGTSFSSPIVAGLSACLRQAYPNHSTENIRQTILQSADQYYTPDTLKGFGVPNFDIAYNNVISREEFQPKNNITLFPNPVREKITVRWEDGFNPSGIRIYNMSGQMLSENTITSGIREINCPVSHLPSGKYIAHLYGQERAVVQSFIKVSP